MDKTHASTSELNTDLTRANLRLGLIARMAKSNIEEPHTELEFVDVMQAILAACGLEDSGSTQKSPGRKLA